jgi:redox-sensitive bicupin YhaK (pirin superfamily)
MFPLLQTDQPNPAELFQIWLNLPAKNKMVEPHFTMFWNENIARVRTQDAMGHATEVLCVAGALGDAKGLPPPPDSWASQSGADVAIFTITMQAKARWTLPAASGNGTRRMVYFFKGSALNIAGQSVPTSSAIELRAGVDAEFVSGDSPCEILVLQGQPINEPVAQYGPFVMNTQAEIQQAFADYRRTEFGGWPWGSSDPVHPREKGRFALHANGRQEDR